MSAFSSCESLASVTLGNSVTTIDAFAFSGTGLTSITIGASVTTIGNGAFGNKLTEINVSGENTNFSSLNGVLFNKDQSTLLLFPAGNNTSEYTIPASVTAIGPGAFSACSNLTSVKIPNSVETIGDQAFFQCSGLETIELGNSVTEIGRQAFQSCSSLSSITLPASVTTLGAYPFLLCTQLEAINVSADNNSFSSLNGVLFNKEQTVLLLYPFGKKDNTYSIPSTVTEIGDQAFAHCFPLESIEIPTSVTTIGIEAFAYCFGLKSITIPNSVTSIGNRAFVGCPALTEIEFPESVTTIGDYAFSRCDNATTLKIGNSVQALGLRAFYCSALTTIYSSAAVPPSCTDPYLFMYLFADETYRNATLYVPEESVEAYKLADGWKQFLKIEGDPSLGIEDKAMTETVTIECLNGCIRVSGAEKVNVYNLSGTKVYSGTAATISLPSGVYIVRADSITRKVNI
ncbi:MAG: leucine-rich repeat protein [Bacteroides sp.]|nr:leucine-rich repeat protein [Bacteroides sp.]